MTTPELWAIVTSGVHTTTETTVSNGRSRIGRAIFFNL
jgi:hypothetical protein